MQTSTQFSLGLSHEYVATESSQVFFTSLGNELLPKSLAEIRGDLIPEFDGSSMYLWPSFQLELSRAPCDYNLSYRIQNSETQFIALETNLSLNGSLYTHSMFSPSFEPLHTPFSLTIPTTSNIEFDSSPMTQNSAQLNTEIESNISDFAMSDLVSVPMNHGIFINSHNDMFQGRQEIEFDDAEQVTVQSSTGSNITPTDPVIGTGGADDITTARGGQAILSLGGDDRVDGGAGDDEIIGGSGNDILYGGTGNDIINGGAGTRYMSMDELTITQSYQGQIVFEGESAGYRNTLGSYVIDENGNITGVQFHFVNASSQGSGGDLIPGVSSSPLYLEAGQQLGFFIVANGYNVNNQYQGLDFSTGSLEFRDADGNLANTSDTNPTLWFVAADGTETQILQNNYHSTGGPDGEYNLNPDGIEHVVGLLTPADGTLRIGFEDLFGGGDNDFDDCVLTLYLGEVNTASAPPPADPPANFSDNDELHGGDGNDELHGKSGNDVIYGEKHNDTIYSGSGDDIAYGGHGHDHIEGNSGNDTLYGGTGNDNILGGSGNDIIHGGNYNDTLEGNSGDDVINGEHGHDIILGGIGQDILSGGQGQDTISGHSGNDVIRGDSGNDVIDGGDGHDDIEGGSGQDTINGSYGDDFIKGNSGSDIINGADGIDNIEGGSGSDTINGGYGNDVLYGNSGYDIISGDNGDDTIDGGSGQDTISGGNGHDLILGGSGSDIISGGNDNDTIYGGSSIDEIDGDAGDDNLYGDSGSDVISGGAGNDYINGGSGRDTLNGGSGDDLIESGSSRDTVNGGSGIDTISYIAATRAVYVDLHGKRSAGGDSDLLYSIENAIGSNFDDMLKGTTGNNVLEGGQGNDILRGLQGNDTLTGGSGNDIFTWQDADLVNFLDVITDFEIGSDRLQFNLSNQLTLDNVSEWCNIIEQDGNTIVQIDRDGAGDTYGFVDCVVLENMTNIDVGQLNIDLVG